MTGKTARKQLKIGQKLSAGDDIHNKRFTNGHKAFTAAEARAITECQRAERRTMENFAANMHSMYRSRDPLIGESTPRWDAPGRELLQPGLPQYVPKEALLVTGKIGVPEYRDGIPQHAPNTKIKSLRRLQDNIAGELEFLKNKLENDNTVLKYNAFKNKSTTLQRIRNRDP